MMSHDVTWGHMMLQYLKSSSSRFFLQGPGNKAGMKLEYQSS